MEGKGKDKEISNVIFLNSKSFDQQLVKLGLQSLSDSLGYFMDIPMYQKHADKLYDIFKEIEDMNLNNENYMN